MTRNAAAGVIVSVMVLSGAVTAVQAQTVFGGVGWTSGWDDETNLGKGVLVSGGVAQPLGRHLSVEGEVSWACHFRDSGYLAAEGTPLIGTARLAYLFQPPESRTRAFASAGLGLVHSTGQFTTRTILAGPGGFPVEGPSIRSDWSLTKPAFEIGGGVSIKSGDRLSFRPEGRWTSTVHDDASSHSTLEPPLWILRAGVTVEWRMRR
jgi:opacity protein-like surface antigen